MEYCKDRKGRVFIEENGKFDMTTTKLTLRITNDSVGKSLSISDDRGGVMFHIGVSDIAEEIREVLK